MDNSKKLSSPGFELYESGLEVKPEGEQLKTSMAVKRIIRYETIIIDNNFKRNLIRFYQVLQIVFANLMGLLFNHFLNGNAVTRSVVSQKHQKNLQPNEEVIKVQPNQYSVATVKDNKPITDVEGKALSEFTSHGNAMNHMQDLIDKNPAIAKQFHVIPNTEANNAA